MKQVEIKSTESGPIQPIKSRKRFSDLSIIRFNFVNSTKQIFKKKTKPAAKRRTPITIQLQHQPSTESTIDVKSQALPILQSKYCESQIQFSNIFECPPKPSKQECLSTNLILSDQVEQNKAKEGDWWIYLPSIGQHLFRQQSRFPMALFVYNEHFDQQHRMGYLQLIFSFCRKFGFKVQTIFLAFNIFHRMAFAQEFQKYHNCAKAVAALFVAAKYQEIAIPKVQIFSKFDPNQRILPQTILKMESQILIYFHFNLGFPTVLQFIDILRIRYNLDRSVRNRLVHVCYKSLSSRLLWQKRGSLLAMACLNLIHPQIQLGQSKSEELSAELSWRVAELVRVGAQA